jgi:hypothetical protein
LDDVDFRWLAVVSLLGLLLRCLEFELGFIAIKYANMLHNEDQVGCAAVVYLILSSVPKALLQTS